tara:strand:- start:727 stop:1545 length:819 start_codon:yes stop_codon:yes gene_type:complete
MNNRLKKIIYLGSLLLRFKTKVFDRLTNFFNISKFNERNSKSEKEELIINKFVPKVLFTSYCCNVDDEIIQQILKEWRQLNDDFEVKYFADEDIDKFFLEETKYFDVYSKLKNGVVKADFFRISYLNKFGGYWFDIDLEPFKVIYPKKGKVHLFDCGFGNISYMFIGGVKNEIFEETLRNVANRIKQNLPHKLTGVMEISGPRVIQSILSKKIGFKLKDQKFIGRRKSKTFLEGSKYEFVYMRQNNRKVKSSLYERLQKKYNKLSYDDYDYI